MALSQTLLSVVGLISTFDSGDTMKTAMHARTPGNLVVVIAVVVAVVVI